MLHPLTETKIEHIAWDKTKVYSSFVEEIAKENPEHAPFVGGYITKQSVLDKIKQRPTIDRKALLAHFTEQYTRFGALSDKNKALIQSLESNTTFTLTTGHQLCFLTGPLYLPIKIFQTINLAKKFKSFAPDHNFVPVYWMATEDHDYEEIRSAYIFNKSFSIDSINDQLKVGTLDSDLIKNILEGDLHDVLCRNDIGESVFNFIKKALEASSTLSEFMFTLCHQLFEDEDLLILDADSKLLKEAASGVFTQELNNQDIHKSVMTFESKLKPFTDLSITPRNLNLFAFEDNKRYRLDVEEGVLKNVDTNSEIKPETLLANVENISPNVLCRPLYQEAILPNLAYIGGAAEMGYWAELTETFDVFGLQQPFVVLRNSVMVLGSNEVNKLEKSGLDLVDLFLEDHILNEKIAESNGHNLEQGDIMQAFQEYIDTLLPYVTDVDVTLKSTIMAHKAEEMKYLKELKKDLKKRILTKNEQSVQQILKVREQLLPHRKLNERKINVFEYIVKYGWDFLPKLKEASGAESTGLAVLHMA